MSLQEELSLNEKSRELKAEFNQIIEGYGEGLWAYCRYLTGSPWDGEDLYQETMIKAYGSFYQRWHPTNPKSYLYRVATTTWIDHCRREKRKVGALEEEHLPDEEQPSDNLEVEEALQHLVDLFKPRQTAVFLLSEVFSFTAKEVAGMVRTTPGAVYAVVRRMREKLQKTPIELSKRASANGTATHPVIQKYLKALNEGNVEGVLALYSDSVHNEAALGFQEFSTDENRTGSMKFGLPGFRAEERMLWDRPVIVVFYDGENGPEIHDIQYQEVENNQIVFHRSFYFRKEFLIAAGEELGIPVQRVKPVVNWEND
ncbi:RNA polymerase sigma factor [Thalassobacillus sp. B23F22_16]|uniref:RNA polymerase sigma factor n=1 Tax=Thalassobacillus sp. B23F22_16 TaxID=3459513 RepID=UPI00373E4E85